MRSSLLAHALIALGSLPAVSGEGVVYRNDCGACEHKDTSPEGAHCYMFKTEPKNLCMQHTKFKNIRIEQRTLTKEEEKVSEIDAWNKAVDRKRRERKARRK